MKIREKSLVTINENLGIESKDYPFSTDLRPKSFQDFDSELEFVKSEKK